MNKNLMAIMITIVFLTFIGCQNEVEKIVYVDKTTDGEQGGQVTPPQNNTKITSLQVAINTAEPGSIIDFSDPKYSTITTIEPSININKAVTIKNFDDLKGASLNVSADGVVLSNLGKTSVTTNSSLKISGSSLSSLNIGAVDTGRGEPVVKSRPPKVELLSSDVSSDVIIAIENAALTVFDVTADNIRFDANDTQLTIENKDSVIKNILTDKKCRLVLEDGTSDTIPCSEQKISVSGTGQLTQVNMQAAETLILTKLSPESGLITTMKQDESIDFSSLEVIGTYQKSGAITIYEAGLTYEFVDTVTRLEDVFRIKIGNDTVYTSTGLDENDVRIGQYADFDWTTLQPGYHQAIIEKDFANTALDYRYEFRIAVIDKNVEYHLSDLTVDISKMKKKIYLADETLDLTGLVVKGTYHADAVLAAVDDYEKALLPSEYTVTPAEGYELTTNVEKNIKVTVSANDSDKSAEFEVTVKPSCYVTFNYGYKQEIVRIEKNTKIESPETPIRYGYELKGWYTDENYSSQYIFGSSVNSNTDLFAKWWKTKPAIGSIVYKDTTTADDTNDRYIFTDDVINYNNNNPIGVVFKVDDGTGLMTDLDQTNDIWCDVRIETYKNPQNGNYFNRAGVTQFWCNDNDNQETSLTDGTDNWTAIETMVTEGGKSFFKGPGAFNAEDYPVYQYILGRVSDDVNNPWYMPAIEELLSLLKNNTVVNNALEKIGAVYIDSYRCTYWSSSLANFSYGPIVIRCIEGSDTVYYPYFGSRDVFTLSFDQYNELPSDPSTNGGQKQYRETHVYDVDVSVLKNPSYDLQNAAVLYPHYVRAIRKFSWQSSTTGNNLYNYE